MKRTAETIRGLGRALGFDLVGFGPAAPERRDAFLHEWLARGYAGEMHWLARRAKRRADPRLVLPGAHTAIATALFYEPQEGAPGADLSIARYAGGLDYHELLGERLDAFEAGIAAMEGPTPNFKSYVDTGPLLERPLAARAGLGWVGKNTLLIHPGLGSYLFLGIVLTDLELPHDAREPDHCGSCRACLDACPTGAFPEPYVLDARRCISYTTIEMRGSIPAPLRAAHGDMVFGCDICQEVCPWNRRQLRERPDDPLGLREALAPHDAWRHASLKWLLALDEATWREATRKTAMRRARYRALLRNALVAAGNSGDRSLLPAVERHAAAEDPLLAEHALWALERLGRAPVSS